MSLSDKYCEGWCKENGGKFTDCTGCEIAELEQELAVERESNEAFSNRIEELHKQNQRIRDSYYDLIMQVAIKHPNESRHETAKRYITQSENHCNGPEAKQALEGRDEIT